MHLACSLHSLSTNTTCRLHAFYAHVGTTIPLTGTVQSNLLDFNFPHALKVSVSSSLISVQSYRKGLVMISASFIPSFAFPGKQNCPFLFVPFKKESSNGKQI